MWGAPRKTGDKGFFAPKRVLPALYVAACWLFASHAFSLAGRWRPSHSLGVSPCRVRSSRPSWCLREHGVRTTATVARAAKEEEEEVELRRLKKRELVDMLKSLGAPADGLSKNDLIARILEVQLASSDASQSQQPNQKSQPAAVTPDTASTAQPARASSAAHAYPAEPKAAQRTIAERSQLDGLAVSSGKLLPEGTAQIPVLEPSGGAETLSFQSQWPPTCTCSETQQFSESHSGMRCRHICYVLVKCGVPYAAVADASWQPQAREAECILKGITGRWSPIALST
eukprot:TRINITY_DN17798_c0_g1_i1.p1 TRINITY_DN17798_c0_g1~~TRINITY_DN17798_c0_g1_i1.p1  ORF type:complete len:286 (+),score=26.14 TRINITY_DN17798_c0_g1_i1:170-1027(+)